MSRKARTHARTHARHQQDSERRRTVVASRPTSYVAGPRALPADERHTSGTHPRVVTARPPALPRHELTADGALPVVALTAPEGTTPVAPSTVLARARELLPTPRAALIAMARAAQTRAAFTAALALLALVALQVTIGAPVTAFWVYLNFDPDRGSLLGALVVVLIAASVGALPWRRRGVAVVATVAGYSLTGTRLFLAQLTTPPLPGVPAPPHVTGWALTRALVVLYSLALVCAALGAGVGAELGDWVVVPLWRTRHELVARLTGARAGPRGSQAWRRSVASAAAVLVVAIVCLTSVGGASDLFFYGSQALVQPAQLPVETASATPQAQSPVQAQQGQVLRITYPSAAFGGAQRSFDVYLPPDYAAPATAHVRYAVLYLLHGSPGSPDDMIQHLLPPQTLDTLITTGQIRPLIVVAPDGRSAAPAPTQWMNGTVGHFPVEDAFIQEVIPYVDAHFRTLASAPDRVVGGLSMGGYGAANLAVKHPDVFGGVIAMGAYFAPEGFTSTVNTAWYSANSPAVRLHAAVTAPPVSFYLAAADQDHPYVDQTQAFARQLGTLRATYTLQTWSGGHSWTVWQAQVVAGVRWFFGITGTRQGCASCHNSSLSGQ